MARRGTARRRDRGGEVVQAPRPTRTRLIAALAAFLLCAALAAYPAVGTREVARLLVLGGAAGGLLVAAALLFDREQLVPWALGVLGAEYTGSLFAPGGATGSSAPLYGAGLLLLGELVALSLAHRARLRVERPVLLLRLGTILAAVAGSAAVGTALLALGSSGARAGVGWTIAGTAAAVGAVALVVRAARTPW